MQNSSPRLRSEFLARKGAKLIANFSATKVTSLPSVSVSLSLSLSLSPHAPHTQYRKCFRASYNTETPMLFPQSSIWRDTVPSRESELLRSSSFAKKNNEEVILSDWYHASKYWLFATLARIFSSPRASSRCLPSFASRRRLLGLRRRSFRTPDCRSSVDLDDLGDKKDYEEMLAKKWRLGTDEDVLVLRLNVQANFPEHTRAQAGPLTDYT